MVHEDHALTESEAARRLGISGSTLRNWRHQNVGPAFRRFGRTIRYLASDVNAYIAANAGGPATSPHKTKQ